MAPNCSSIYDAPSADEQRPISLTTARIALGICLGIVLGSMGLIVYAAVSR